MTDFTALDDDWTPGNSKDDMHYVTKEQLERRPPMTPSQKLRMQQSVSLRTRQVKVTLPTEPWK